MSIELRSIRCHYFRVTREPCLNPAAVEVLGPVPRLLCAEHAACELRLESGFAREEGWEGGSAEAYARQCEEAINALDGWTRGSGGDDTVAYNPVLELSLINISEPTRPY